MRKQANHPYWWVYIVQCSDDSYYTGITHNINQRIKQHNSGTKAGGAKYTRARGPVQLVYLQQYSSHIEAARREIEIKKLKRTEKKELIDSFPTN
jgi:putative endonuclease